MRLVEILESRKQALRVSEVATLFAVTSQHIYKMTAKGMYKKLGLLGVEHIHHRWRALYALPSSGAMA